MTKKVMNKNTKSITPKLIKYIELSFSKGAKNTAFLTESISNSETIKSMALERVMLKRWNKQKTQSQ
jgi:ATP-binding cassette subfamily B protein RtxB